MREARGISLEALATEAGTTNQQVSLLETGKRRLPDAEPRVEAVGILADGEELLRMSRRRGAEGLADFLRLDRVEIRHPVFLQVLRAIIEVHTTSAEMKEGDLDGALQAIDELLPELQIPIDRFLPSGVGLPKAESSDSPTQSMLFAISKGNRKEDIAQAVRFLLPRTLNDLVKGLADVLSDELKQLQYLGPLRSFSTPAGRATTPPEPA